MVATRRKLRPVHEVIIELLKVEKGHAPDYVPVYASLYARGALCPKGAIDSLIAAFLEAIKGELLDEEQLETVEEAIRSLYGQKREDHGS